MIVTDTHCHLFWPDFDGELAAVLERARGQDVRRMVVVGTDLTSSLAALDMAASHDGLFATAGVHPHDAGGLDAETRRAIEELCRRPDCHGVGETGLDHFKGFSDPTVQLEAFGWHLELARHLDKPVVVHCRDAHEATLSALAAVPGVRGVMHCYSMGAEELPGYLDLGFHISFSGVVTYPKNTRNREAARAVPAERLLVETDAPFLAPQGKRGQRNEPASARDVLELLAKERGVAAEELAWQTSSNAAALFGLPELSTNEPR